AKVWILAELVIRRDRLPRSTASMLISSRTARPPQIRISSAQAPADLAGALGMPEAAAVSEASVKAGPRADDADVAARPRRAQRRRRRPWPWPRSESGRRSS